MQKGAVVIRQLRIYSEFFKTNQETALFGIIAAKTTAGVDHNLHPGAMGGDQLLQ